MKEDGSWNEDLLRSHFLRCDLFEILKINPYPTAQDTIACGPDRFGEFSVKFSYELAFKEANLQDETGSSASPEGARSCWDLIWHSNVPPSIRNCAWRAGTNSLPT